MLRRFIEPVLALRRRRRGAPEQASGAVAPEALAPAAAARPRNARSAGRAAVASDVASNGESNPYVEARRQWSERYGDYIQQAYHWRLLAVLSGLVTLISLAGMGFIGTRSKVIPYLVEMNKFGEVASEGRTRRTGDVDARILRAYLARFIADWRSVTVDRQAQKTAIERVYAMLPRASIALGKLNDHFKTYNPFALAAKESVNVSVTSLLPISEHTWQVEWLEVRRDTLGAIQSRVRLKASIVVGITPPTQENLVLVNPLGIYITDLNWFKPLD